MPVRLPETIRKGKGHFPLPFQLLSWALVTKERQTREKHTHSSEIRFRYLEAFIKGMKT